MNYFLVLGFGQVTDRQKVMHQSPPCRSTGVLKKGNRNVKSDMGFCIESVDLYLVSTFGLQVDSCTCQGYHFCKVLVRPQGPFGCPLKLQSL